MKIKRAITGFLLSFIFLTFFIYLIFNIKWISSDLLKENTTASLVDFKKETINNLEKNNDNYKTEELNINAQSAISVLTDLKDNKIIFGKNSQRKLSIASISKLMTSVIVIDNLDLSKEIKISDQAVNQTTDIEKLKMGEIFFVRDLLYAVLIGSDNAASFALSESIGTEKFIDLMNKKTKEIGLLNTSFSNATGLGLSNFSTSEDLVKMTEYLLENYPFIFEITTIPEFNLYTSDGKVLHKIINTNNFIKNQSNLTRRIIGGKTGQTRTAGECLLLVLKSLDNKDYIINVILNSDDRFEEMKKIINWANY